MIEVAVTTVDQPAMVAMIFDPKDPAAMPISPPTIQISTASIKNCRTISF